MEDRILKFRWFILTFLIGSISIIAGVILLLSQNTNSIEILNDTNSNLVEESIVVEIAGAVEKPGIYKFKNGDRMEDLLISAGGLSVNANRDYVAKIINRASLLTDAQKVYIPSVDEQTAVLSANNNDGGLMGKEGGNQESTSTISQRININTSTSSQLEDLWGIGRITAQNIIEHRPYSSVEELLTKGILKKNVYEKNREILSVY